MKKSELIWMIILIILLVCVFCSSIKAYAVDDDTMNQITAAAEGAAERYEIPVELILAVIETESTYRPDAKNGSCRGLMQIHTVNLDWLERDFGRELDLYDIEDNVYAGSYILAGYYHKYGLHRGLMSYNGGQGYMRKMVRNGYGSSKYSRKVVEIMEEMQDEDNI
jgi:soluble lytic murein transglycosylase-like protein